MRGKKKRVAEHITSFLFIDARDLGAREKKKEK